MTQLVPYRDRIHFGLTPYSDELKEIAASTPGVRWDARNKAYVGYSDGIAAAAARLETKVQPIVTPKFDASTLAVAYKGLRDYQKIGVDFCVEHAHEGVILADAMALGKSIQAIRAARAFKAKTVIVCPSFVRLNWLREIGKWWPDAAPGTDTLSGTKSEPIDPATGAIVIHYDILYAWVDALIAWGMKVVVFDELHALMSSESRRTKAATALARACFWRIGLTGTPITSRVRDLYAPVEVLSPGRFGRFWDFGLRYCAGHQEQVIPDEHLQRGIPEKVVWNFDGASNEKELHARLQHFMLRRTRADVAIEMPPMTRQVVELEVARKNTISPEKALANDKMLRKALDAAADGKVPQIVEMAQNYLAAGHKVVVFSYRKIIGQLIAEDVKAKSTQVINGDVPHGKRQKIIDTKPDLLCATMDSCGVGISLAYADVAIFAELHYVPSVLLQAEARLPRPDSKHASVLVVYACARGTGDDIVRRVVLSKLTTFEKTIGKTTDALVDDLDSSKKESAVTRMRRLYERILKQDERAE